MTQAQPVRSRWLWRLASAPLWPPRELPLLSPHLSQTKTLDKAGVLHRTKTVDKGKRLR